jgi:hypothetical protein
MTRQPLFTEGPAKDSSFLLCRDEKMYRNCRDFIEELWIKYAPYCPDTHFERETREQFHQRTWEMYLACALMDSGHKLRKTRSCGPDLCVEGDVPIWIEAVAVEPGDTADRVKNEEERRDTNIPQEEGVCIGDPPSEERLILRCTNAMDNKIKQVKKYKRDGLVSEHDSFVVAISLGKIVSAPMGASIFIKSFFGIGDEYVAYTPNPGKSSLRHGYLDRPVIDKISGQPVSTRKFLGKDAIDVSGILGSCIDIFNVQHMPSDIILINNPMAIAPYRSRSIRLGSEYRAENGIIKPLYPK